MSQVTPSPAHPRPLDAFRRAVTQFDRTQINVWMGARNALGIALPLAVGVDLGHTGSGLVAATGALNVAAADGVDSYRQRAARMVAASVVGAITVFVSALLGGSDALTVAMRVLWAFACGLLVCLGPVAADIGTISLVVFIIFSAQAMTPSDAAWAGVIALGGGLLQTLLSIALWPIRGFQPERRVIGGYYQELARAATALPSPYGAPLASQQSTQAREAVSALTGDHRVEAERLFQLVSQAERIRLSLFAVRGSMVRLRRQVAGEPAAAAIDRLLALASSLLSSVGISLHHGGPLPDSVPALLEEAASAVESLRLAEAHGERSAPARPLLSEARSQADGLAGQLRAAIELARNTTPAGEAAFAAREVAVPWHLRLSGWLAILSANLSLDSSACRHAIRLAICIIIGDVMAHFFSLPRSYWLTMTVALVLKPDFGSTFSRGALRLAGTYAGLMLATVLFHYLSPTPSIDVLWIGLLAFVLRSVGRANYGLLVTAISALIVFLFSLTGVAPKDVIAARALNSTIGGILAMAIYSVWPTRERTQVPQALASMLDSYRAYLQAVSRAYIDGRSVAPHELDRLRLNGRRARSNVETAVDRLSAEPYVEAEPLRLLNAMLASSHRFVHALMALEAALTSGPSAPAPEAFQTFSHDLEIVLFLLESRLRGSPVTPDRLPDLREDHNRLVRAGDSLDGRHAWLSIETDRMTNSLNTLADQLFKWIAFRR